MESDIDFTTTATIRPEVFRRTLISFEQNLRGVDFSQSTLHLNIDPVPAERRQHWADMVAVADQFFAQVHPHMPATASFPAAVKWCWSRPKTKYFFHLEDDWEIIRPFELSNAVTMLERHSELSCINLRAYMGIQDDRICLSPCLMRTEHAHEMAGRLVLTVNPEKQLRPTTLGNPCGGKHEGFFGVQVPQQPIIRDIGREWLLGSGWRKPATTVQQNGLPVLTDVYFTTWEKVG